MPSSWDIIALRLETRWRRRQRSRPDRETVGLIELPGDHEQLIQGQQEGLAQRHHHRSLETGGEWRAGCGAGGNGRGCDLVSAI